MLLGICAFLVKYSEEITELKEDIRDELRATQVSPTPTPALQLSDFQSSPPIEHRKDAWYLSSRLISHACGGVHGLTYTNSKEALQTALACGIRTIEVDFLYTSDGELVCAHEWQDLLDSDTVPTSAEFYSLKIYGKYTTMHAKDIIAAMAEYDDMYLIIDTKEKDRVQVIRDLVSLCNGDDSIIRRLVVQLYDRGCKDQILAIYPFSDENFLFTCYYFGSRRTTEIMQLCYDENIRVITVPNSKWDQDTLDFFIDKGFIIYEHTENRPDRANRALQRGIHGIYTDFLIESDLQS